MKINSNIAGSKPQPENGGEKVKLKQAKICPQCEEGIVPPQKRICSECRLVNLDISAKKTQLRYREKPEARYVYAKKYAEKKGIPWGLEFQQWFNMVDEGCYSCGDKYKTISTPGLDMNNKDKGYVNGNVAPICGNCGELRKLLSAEEVFYIISSRRSSA